MGVAVRALGRAVAQLGLDGLDRVPARDRPIIDHADSTINFERPGRTPYLYYVRFTPGAGPNDDIVRVSRTFTIL